MSTTPIDIQARSVHSSVLPHRPEAAGIARRRARTALLGWGLDPMSADALLLVVSELVTNAVVHALPPIGLRLRRVECCEGPAVRVEVTDAGPSRCVFGNPSTGCELTEGGRGTALVAALSSGHGTHAQHGALTRWAEIPVG